MSFKPLIIALALGGAAVSVALAAPGNIALGEWELDKPGCDVVTKIVFKPTTYASFQTPDGVFPGWSTLPVTYNASKTEVWILPKGYGSNQTRVLVLDANHIRTDYGKRCVYKRVK